jgi:hypothetical protein
MSPTEVSPLPKIEIRQDDIFSYEYRKGQPGQRHFEWHVPAVPKVVDAGVAQHKQSVPLPAAMMLFAET